MVRNFMRGCGRRASTMLMVSLTLLTACGGDDKKDSGDGGPCAGNCIFKAKGDVIEVNIATATAGSQYIVMPYVIGNIKTVEGGSKATTFTLKVEKTAGKGASLRPLIPAKVRAQYALQNQGDASMDWKSYDHALRSLLNRFRPSQGLRQSPGFWQEAQSLDRVSEIALGGQNSGQGFLSESVPTSLGVERAFREMSAKPSTPRALHSTTHLTTTAVSCPTKEMQVLGPTGAYAADEVTKVLEAAEDEHFCIAYLSTPKTETDKAAIKASVKTIIERYKTVIYKDQFAEVNGFSFKPIIAIVDFHDASVWPPQENGDAKNPFLVSGFLSPEASNGLKTPVLYMAADFSALGSRFKGMDPVKAKKAWHGTLAHELQHAVMNYYRSHSVTGGVEEALAIDEGLAHYMEDLFGYGDENFSSYSKAFLDVFAFGSSPFLYAEDVVKNDVARGAAQTLLYYLSSQKGGVNFTSGIVSGGEGLAYITWIVKNTANSGPANLAAAFSDKDWVNVVGGYLGALAIDNLNAPGAAAEFKVQEPVTGVHDLNGNTDKTFGMRFNGFGSVADHLSEYSKLVDPEDPTASVKEVVVQHYQTQPILYTVTDPTEILRFKLVDAEASNAAVSVVRIK